MEKEKKIFYGGLIIIAVIAAIIIQRTPVKKPLKSMKTEKNTILEQNTSWDDKEEEKEVIEKKVLDFKEEFKERNVKRNIFDSPYLKKIIKQEVVAAEEKLPFEIKGVFIVSEDIKSVILSTGEIVNEGEIVKSYTIEKIAREKVLVKNSEGKEWKINLWEEQK